MPKVIKAPVKLVAVKPLTGLRHPDYADDVAQARAERARSAFNSVWVDYGPQSSIINRLVLFHRQTREISGGAYPGRRLCEATHAGKSSTLEKFRQRLMDAEVAEGRVPNPYQVLIVGLDERNNLKGVYQDILIALGDPNFGDGKEKELRERIRTFFRRFGVELLVIDEVQHLRGVADDNVRSGRARSVADHRADVSDALKRFLDLGIVPVIFVGDHTSESFFQFRPQLAARCGTPLDLAPVLQGSPAERTQDFRNFCRSFDAALFDANAIRMTAGLDGKATLDRLLAVSSGHIGRVARLLGEATEHAACRNAVTIEAWDLLVATRDYAMRVGWIDWNPFETMPVAE